MSLTADRAALKTALEATGLEVVDKERDSLNPPCLVIGNPVGTYNDDFEGGYTRTFPVTLLTQRTQPERAIAFIDPYVDTTGSQSVYAAVAALQNAAVIGFSQFGGGYTVGEIEYAGVTFEVHLL